MHTAILVQSLKHTQCGSPNSTLGQHTISRKHRDYVHAKNPHKQTLAIALANTGRSVFIDRLPYSLGQGNLHPRLPPPRSMGYKSAPLARQFPPGFSVSNAC